MPTSTAATLNDARARGGRIVAVGTTSVRLLESAAREDGVLEAFEGETAIFIIGAIVFAVTVYGVVMAGGAILSEMVDEAESSTDDL